MIDLKILGIGVHQDEGLPVLLLYLMGKEKILSLPLEDGDIFTISTALQGLENKEHPALLDFGKAVQLDETEHDLEDISPTLDAGLGTRPVATNLTLKLVRILGGQIMGIEIVALKNGIPITQVICAQGSNISRLGCHVVDGILLALHGNCILRCADELVNIAVPVQEALQRFPDNIKKIIESAIYAFKEADDASLRVNQQEERDQFQDKIAQALSAMDDATSVSFTKVDGSKRPRIEVKIVKATALPTPPVPTPALEDVFHNMQIKAGAIPAPVQEYLRGNRDILRGKKFQAGVWDDLLQILVPEIKKPM